jgi:hypothetical protein
MSAYGAITHPDSGNRIPLASRVWLVESSSPSGGQNLTTHHLTLPVARQFPGFIEHLNAVFAKEVDDGLTYPQEGAIERSAFEDYFFAADVFVAIVGGVAQADRSEIDLELGIEDARSGRAWEECVAGFYYVGNITLSHYGQCWLSFETKTISQIKPNYPGRSSHVGRAHLIFRIDDDCRYRSATPALSSLLDTEVEALDPF